MHDIYLDSGAVYRWATSQRSGLLIPRVNRDHVKPPRAFISKII
jgi:hypothetical protein